MNLDSAYREAENLAKSHYENFPVISFMVKKKLRKHVAVIYTFAREADDLADEGNALPYERIKALEDYEKKLMAALGGDPVSDFWQCLANTISEKKLTVKNFTNLLSAFKQDVEKRRYESGSEVLDYCSRSANPVGRLILELNGIFSEEAIGYSDQICTALQITNFLQDIAVDLTKDRIYLPRAEMQKFGVIEEQLFERKFTEGTRELIRSEAEKTKAMFKEGSRLLNFLSGRLKVQIQWTILGGKRILAKIAENDYNVLLNRPVISKTDYFGLFLKSLFLR